MKWYVYANNTYATGKVLISFVLFPMQNFGFQLLKLSSQVELPLACLVWQEDFSAQKKFKKGRKSHVLD